jgi:hypothetical protein
MRLMEVLAASSPHANPSELTYNVLQPLSHAALVARSLLELLSGSVSAQQQFIDSLTICCEYFVDTTLYCYYISVRVATGLPEQYI